MPSSQKSKPRKTTTEKHQTANNTRKLKPPGYVSFHLHKRIKHPGAKLAGSWSLLRGGFGHIGKHWKLFGGIGLVYALLVIVLVRNFTVTGNLSELKELLDEIFASQTGGSFVTGFVLFNSLLAFSTSVSGPSAGVFQLIFVILVSLAVIWALRQTYAGERPRIRDAFYKGMYPLVPYILVILVVLLQLIPFLIGSTLFSAVVQNGLAVNFAEYVLWGSLFFTLALLSLYMLSSSIFALYIVTLPDVTPLQALRSARELVRFRRWAVLRRVVMLPILLLIIGFLLAMPIILLAPRAAEILFLLAALFVIVIAHSYMYKLYRELL